MDSSYDSAIIGAGPAGVSAALTLAARGKSTVVISNNPEKSPLFRAESIDNYPGLSKITGKELIGRLSEHLRELSIPVITGRAMNAMAFDSRFNVSYGAGFLNCGALIICTGIVSKNVLPGEREFLGRGLSYCATCDGMLYKGKKIAVIAKSADAAEEADFLRGIGCDVEYFGEGRAKKFIISGGDSVESLIADDIEYPVSAVFILRDTVSVDTLLPGLAGEDGAIAVSGDMSARVPGVFAAGDCTGKPYQIAKAVGQGNIAALSAASYLDAPKNA